MGRRRGDGCSRSCTSRRPACSCCCRGGPCLWAAARSVSQASEHALGPRCELTVGPADVAAAVVRPAAVDLEYQLRDREVRRRHLDVVAVVLQHGQRRCEKKKRRPWLPRELLDAHRGVRRRVGALERRVDRAQVEVQVALRVAGVHVDGRRRCGRSRSARSSSARSSGAGRSRRDRRTVAARVDVVDLDLRGVRGIDLLRGGPGHEEQERGG